MRRDHFRYINARCCPWPLPFLRYADRTAIVVVGMNVPEFHTSHDAKHTLLVWVFKDRAQEKYMSNGPIGLSSRFIGILHQQGMHEIEAGAEIDSIAQYMLTISPEAVAIAADEALRAAGYYGEVEK